MHALVDALDDTFAEVEALTLGDKRGDADALLDTLADALAEMEAVTLDTHGVMCTLWSTLWLTRLQR